MTAGDIEIVRSNVEIDIDAPADIEPIFFSPGGGLFTDTNFDVIRTKNTPTQNFFFFP